MTLETANQILTEIADDEMTGLEMTLVMAVKTLRADVASLRQQIAELKKGNK